MNFETTPSNILYIASRGDSGAGGENYLLTLFRNIDRSKFKPYVVLPTDGSLRKPLEDLEIEIFILDANYSWLQPDVAWYRALEGLQGRVKKLADFIQKNNISIVHTNSNLRFEGALAARLTGTPHLYLAHIEFQPDMPIFQRLPLSQPSFAQLMLELSDHIVAVSQSVASTIVVNNNTQVPVDIIHNGLELDIFDQTPSNSSATLQAELGLQPTDIIVCAVGRIAPDKGFDYLLEAANLVIRKHSKVHFLIAGAEENTEHASSLKEKASSYGIDSQFHFIGFRTDVPSILAASDIFILSSRKEGHPYVMLEAMASNCAVVACNCAGVEETIVDGESGFIVPIGSIDDIVSKLELLIESPTLMVSLATAARKRVESSFTANKTANSLMSVYDTLLALPASKTGSISTELFIQNCKELGQLGLTNAELESRIQRLENLANIIQKNPLANALRSLRNILR